MKPVYLGDYVVMPYHGRELLGEVVDLGRDFDGFWLCVRRFNGEPWPVHPLAEEVTVIDPDWTPITEGQAEGKEK